MTDQPKLADAFPSRRQRRPRLHPPTDAELDAAQASYDAHSPSLVTYLCVAEGCDERWPCAQYRAAETDLILSGRLQVSPVPPSL